jgi:transposase
VPRRQPDGGVSSVETVGIAPEKKSLRAAEQDRPDVAEKRRVWLKQRGAIPLDRWVFYDESGAKTNMTRLYGRKLNGDRLVDAVPHGHWSTTSMLSCLRLDGSTAAMSLDGATDRVAFETYVERVLVQSLRPGDVVVMDNLAPHKSPQAAELIEDAGAEIRFLPPYSPDFNPIEKMWSKVKAHLRKAKPRSRTALDRAIGRALRAITAEDAKGWFASCGYMQS